MDHLAPLCCAVCHRSIAGVEEGRHRCECGSAYEFARGVLRYEWKPLLFKKYRRQFLFSSALNNNGHLSYLLLPEGSVSLPEREDVTRFREYLLDHAERGTLLDVECGPLELPGYLSFSDCDRDAFRFIGLDRLADSAFDGLRIVRCAEFVPLCSESIDTAVFATSLDHVCNLDQTIREARRVLRRGGVAVVWMSDRTHTFRSAGEVFLTFRALH